jgi:hypothetical protein
MHFRIFIHKDEQAEDRGFSLKGIKVPLTSFCPKRATPDVLGLDNKPIFLTTPYYEFWDIPVSLLVMARPSLARHLRHLDSLLVPIEWCDIAPVDSTAQVLGS